MRLIAELCKERGLSAIINIHDVMLAQMFAERIVGLRLGEVVYDGPPDGLTAEVLTEIYGEEDWEATIRKAAADEDAGDDEGGGEAHLLQLERDSLAGLPCAPTFPWPPPLPIGRASCRERGCKAVSISVVAGT